MNQYQLNVCLKIIERKGGCGNNEYYTCDKCESDLYYFICSPPRSICKNTEDLLRVRYAYAIRRLQETDNNNLLFEALL